MISKISSSINSVHLVSFVDIFFFFSKKEKDKKEEKETQIQSVVNSLLYIYLV
jgi:hypothetical protein